jgi:phage terminase large subunit GpA-like protein
MSNQRNQHREKFEKQKKQVTLTTVQYSTVHSQINRKIEGERPGSAPFI